MYLAISFVLVVGTLLQSTAAAEVCKDNDDRCEIARAFECEKYPEFMFTNCKMSCELCGPENKYEDEDVRCPDWARTGYCKSNPDINLKCPYSCRKYEDIAEAPKPYPYPVTALHPYPNPYPYPSPYPSPYAYPYPNPYPSPYPYPYPSPYSASNPYPYPSPYPMPAPEPSP